jgi:hypothetical protein
LSIAAADEGEDIVVGAVGWYAGAIRILKARGVLLNEKRHCACWKAAILKSVKIVL